MVQKYPQESFVTPKGVLVYTKLSGKAIDLFKSAPRYTASVKFPSTSQEAIRMKKIITEYWGSNINLIHYCTLAE